MKLTKKAFATSLAVAALALPLAACGGSSNNSDEGKKGDSPSASADASAAAKLADYNPQPRDNVKDGGTLTQALPSIPEQLNTFQGDADAYAAVLWAYLNPQMVFYAPDGTWSFNKDYLTDVQEKEQGGNTVVTYTINPKAVWNDGSPITWESFKITAEANSGKDDAYVPSSSDGYSSIKSVTQGTDERQAVVTFDGPWAWWQGLFNNILNPHVKSADVYNKAYINNLHNEWGAGPFALKSFDQKGGVVTLERNPKWWGDPAKLDTVIFKQMEDTASINAFKNGEIDLTGVGSKDRLSQVQDMDGITIHRAGSVSTDLLELNSKSANLSDPNVRKAFFESLDRKTLAEIRYQGLDYDQPLPGSLNLFSFQEGYKDSLVDAGYEYSTEEAGKLLDAAGWKMGSNGIREKDGKSLTIDYPFIGDDPTLLAQAKAMIAMAKKAGFDVKMRNVPSADFGKEFTGGKWDLFALGFSSSDPFGVAYMCQIYCSDSSLNLSGTGTKEIDAKVKDLQSMPTAEEQIAAAMPLETEIIGETWGMMPTDTRPTLTATKEGLANIGPEPYFGPDLFGTQPVQNIGWEK